MILRTDWNTRRGNIATKSIKNRRKSVLSMSTEHRFRRFKSCYAAISIMANGATATATNL
jgi:hypothetical protein